MGVDAIVVLARIRESLILRRVDMIDLLLVDGREIRKRAGLERPRMKGRVKGQLVHSYAKTRLMIGPFRLASGLQLR